MNSLSGHLVYMKLHWMQEEAKADRTLHEWWAYYVKRNFAKSTNASGNCFTSGISSLFWKAGRTICRREKSWCLHGNSIVQTRTGFPWCWWLAAYNVLFFGFKSSFPPVSGFTGYGLALRVEHRAAAIPHTDFSSENTSIRKFSFLKNQAIAWWVL